MMAVMAILSLNGCSGDGSKDNPDKPNTNLPDLKVSFSSDSFTCNPGETMSLPLHLSAKFLFLWRRIFKDPSHLLLQHIQMASLSQSLWK